MNRRGFLGLFAAAPIAARVAAVPSPDKPLSAESLTALRGGFMTVEAARAEQGFARLPILFPGEKLSAEFLNSQVRKFSEVLLESDRPDGVIEIVHVPRDG